MATNFSIYHQQQLIPHSQAGTRGQQDQRYPAEGTQKKGWCMGINPTVTATPACVTDTATEWERTPAADPPLTHEHLSTEEQCRLTSRQPQELPTPEMCPHTRGTSGRGDLPASSRSLAPRPMLHTPPARTPTWQANYTHTAVHEDLAFTQVILIKTQVQTQTTHATSIFIIIIRTMGSASALTAKRHLFKD